MPLQNNVLLLSLILFLVSLVLPASASEVNLILSITNPTPTENNGFGSSVAISDFSSDDYLLVGIPNSNVPLYNIPDVINAGSVYLYDEGSAYLNGKFMRTITNPDPAENDRFGWAVTTSLDRPLVSAVGNDVKLKPFGNVIDNAGTVYLFNKFGDLLSSIDNPRPDVDDAFGWSVASISNGILIGTPNDDNIIGVADDFACDTYIIWLACFVLQVFGNIKDSGSVSLYDINGDFIRVINNPNPTEGAHFGYSVASTPDGTLVVGAYGSNAVYLFEKKSGNLLLTINSPSGAGDLFGISVATIKNGNILVASTGTGAKNAGVVYLFDETLRGSTNTPLLTLNSPNPFDFERFGHIIASTSDGDIVVSAPGLRQESGKAYIFDGELRGTTNTPLLTIDNPTPAYYQFGGSLATHKNKIVIGSSSGIVHLFE